jgi:two-component system cell cycle sensor histidine kinase/response regulator CckA
MSTLLLYAALIAAVAFLLLRLCVLARREAGARALADTLKEEMERRVDERTKALSESEDRLRRVVQTTNDAVWEWDIPADTVTWNDGIERLFGYDPKKVDTAVTWWSARIHDDDRERVLSGLDALLADAERHWSEGYRFQKADGSYAHVFDRASVIRDGGGRAVRMVGAMVDETDRHRVDRALRETGERYHALFNKNPLPMWVSEVDSLRFLAVNNSALALYGYSREEFLALSARDIRPREDVALLTELLSKKTAGPRNAGVWRHKKKNGAIFDVQVDVADMSFGGRPAYLVTARDVSEQRQLENQLRQVQKMDAVGRLAGGMAHDFNNLLFVMGGYAEQVLRGLDREHPLRGKLEGIQRATERAASLTRQLLTFSRNEPVQPKVLSLNTVVPEMDKMLRRLIGEHIDLRTSLSPALGRTRIDPGHLEQVLMNLVVNARDAMPSGGRLTLETTDVALDEAYARTRVGLEPGRFVMLAVSDTGHGMDAGTIEHIFEPFFTTKGADKGTGLGLSIVYGIVQQAGGHISVYSEPGRGATFRVYFPRVDAAVDSTVAPEDSAGARGWETVLLVEDEAAVRELARETLEGHGYRVLEARHGREALHVLGQSGQEIHLLLTDVVLPDITGKEVADAVLGLRPDVQILFMSGYTGGALMGLDRLPTNAAFLAKPFTLATLLRRTREMLGSPERLALRA